MNIGWDCAHRELKSKAPLLAKNARNGAPSRHGYLISPEEEQFLRRLVEFRPAVRLYREGRATGPPERVSRGDTLREKSANRMSISRHPVRRVSGAAPRTGRLATRNWQLFRPSAVQA